jgi:uncharacterized protein (UPF0261 family)
MSRIAISASAVDLPGGGLTTPCVAEVQRLLTAAGHEARVVLATGAGGRELEAALAAGTFAGVVDLTLSELADTLVGGIYSAGPDRLTAAGLLGVPQVIAPGAVDAARLGSLDDMPAKYRARRRCSIDPTHTLLRTTPEENDQLGREIALKISAARGPAAVLLPLRGLSALDRPGQPFHWPEADATLFQSVRNWISPHVRLVELDCHLNDLDFAQTAAAVLLEMLAKVQ